VTRPHLLVLGHVTRDEVGRELRLGGAASYAALAAARLGFDTAVVTVAPPDDPLLAPLRNTPGLAIHCAVSPVMTTFALQYEGTRRSLTLRTRARALGPGDVPAAWRRPAVAYLGPVAGECGRALIASLGAGFTGVGLQGWLRRAADDGRIEPALSPEAIDPPTVGLAIVSEQDHPDVDGVAARFAASGAMVAITRGARGATLLTPSGRLEIPAVPAIEIDPTGAGDVFGVVLTLRLAAGVSPAQAAADAAVAGARVVEGPGLRRLG
jgi:sugar/nucleoside kinase (ribokinase family)